MFFYGYLFIIILVLYVIISENACACLARSCGAKDLGHSPIQSFQILRDCGEEYIHLAIVFCTDI